MISRCVIFAAFLAVTIAFPFPERGFRPVQGSRGHSHSESKVSTNRIVPRDVRGSGFGGNFHSAGPQISHGGQSHLGEPDKTIYVRLQDDQQHAHIAPKSAGPPQKHYRIVIIRSPTPPPVQQVLPPRSEQKTIIYVLHQKPKPAQQQVLEAPVVKHPPQVLFVGYDDELSSDDLQQLAKGDHTGFSVSSQQQPIVGDVDGSFEGHGQQGFGGGFGSTISALEPFHQSSIGGNRGGLSYNRRSS